jgi:hypothetical protein
MGVAGEPVLREMTGARIVTEWYCQPPPWGSTFVVASKDQEWLDGDPGIAAIRRVFAWRFVGVSASEVNCGDYVLRVIPDTWS